MQHDGGLSLILKRAASLIKALSFALILWPHEELPGANTQGETREEVRENLEEAIELVWEANRVLAEEHRLCIAP